MVLPGNSGSLNALCTNLEWWYLIIEELRDPHFMLFVTNPSSVPVSTEPFDNMLTAILPSLPSLLEFFSGSNGPCTYTHMLDQWRLNSRMVENSPTSWHQQAFILLRIVIPWSFSDSLLQGWRTWSPGRDFEVCDLMNTKLKGKKPQQSFPCYPIAGCLRRGHLVKTTHSLPFIRFSPWVYCQPVSVRAGIKAKDPQVHCWFWTSDL